MHNDLKTYIWVFIVSLFLGFGVLKFFEAWDSFQSAPQQETIIHIRLEGLPHM